MDKLNNSWKALQYMFISTLSFTIMNSLIKYLDGFHQFELVFFRCFGSLIICLTYLKVYRIPVIGNQHKLMIGRAIVGLTSMILFFSALKILPFGATVSMRYLAPIFATIMAVFLLKEKVMKIQWFFFLLSFGGVVLIKGFDPRVNITGLVMIMASAFLSGMVYIFLRAIGTRDHPVVVVNYFMVIATLVSGILSIFYWKIPIGREWLILSMLGVLGYLGQLYMTKAFQIETANKVAPMKYLEAIFAIIAGWLFFNEGYSWIGIVGIFLVLAGMLLNILAKQKIEI